MRVGASKSVRLSAGRTGKKAMTMSKIDDMLKVVKAYEEERYDDYERLISEGARKHGIEEWQFEDDCTDVRILGIDRA